MKVTIHFFLFFFILSCGIKSDLVSYKKEIQPKSKNNQNSLIQGRKPFVEHYDEGVNPESFTPPTGLNNTLPGRLPKDPAEKRGSSE